MVDIVHSSVLQHEVLKLLAPERPEACVCDGTLGEGGHAEAFLEAFGSITLVGIDADREILEVARRRLEKYGTRFRSYHAWFNQFFADYPTELPRPDRILLDLGISRFHYERSGRGFSFQQHEPLDMRLSGELEISAFDIVNDYPEEELTSLIREYGEERYAKRIAHAIARERSRESIRDTATLARIVRSTVPPEYRHGRIHPATRTFQALRIAVNGELARLESALEHGLEILSVRGRIGVISFHSLEDRIVKRFFRLKNRDCTCPADWPVCRCGGKRVVDLVTRRPVTPTEEETAGNPAARSAKLRVAEKVHEEAL